jgi:hypothetical protein
MAARFQGKHITPVNVLKAVLSSDTRESVWRGALRQLLGVMPGGGRM